VNRWNQLDPNWQQAMRAAIEAYLDGSAPIGAAIFDASNQVISIGHNDFEQNRLAHAEIQALKGVPPGANREELSLYGTMEPCPMCTGAIRMMQLRSLHFATKDPAAGSTELLSATRFMKQFSCAVIGPSDPCLEFVNVALMLEYRTRNAHARWRNGWSSYLPKPSQSVRSSRPIDVSPVGKRTTLRRRRYSTKFVRISGKAGRVDQCHPPQRV
jgi:tRNA(Arg) A34 adenosine deaminase TadA